METIINKIYLVLSVIVLCTLLVACNNKRAVEKYNFTNAYPKTAFSSVKLFSLPRKISPYYNGHSDTTTFIQDGYGDKFIDSAGKPVNNKYSAYELNNGQVNRLAYFFAEQPCTEKWHMNKACSPVYRNALVFYNAEGKPVGIANICFDCELTAFANSPDYMCDFDNKINYNLLASFINGIKYGGKVAD